MRFDYDAVERSRGANRHFQDRASRKYLRLEPAADAYRRVKRPSNIDVVVFENGDVVTAARLTRRFRRA